MVIVVDRGDGTGVFDLFQILVSCSQFCYVVLCISYVTVMVIVDPK
jgi:hypothetical protein